MPTLTILHTTLATTVSLPPLAAEIMPDVTVRNIADDTILPQLLQSNGDLTLVQERVIQYACYAAQTGAEVVLCACSSIGEIVPIAQEYLPVPILRIDEPMAEEAVRRGKRIGIAATLKTTLEPTTRLILRKAQEAEKDYTIKSCLIEEAYQHLMAGDTQAHDRLLVQCLEELSAETDLIVLAQASMARVLPQLPPDVAEHALTSPRLGLERARDLLTNRGYTS
jgi:Asp/Glu/hydantoin racemase